MQGLWRDVSPSTVVAGFVAVLVGFTSSVAIVFAAAQALGANTAQTASWLWALGLGMAATSIGLSWRYRMPVLTAWSTPGAALLAGTQGVSLPEATGAFVVCALLVTLAGFTRAFERLMDRIPQALAAALLAGVLARFGLDGVLAVRTEPALVLAMFATFLLLRRWVPRYAVPGVLAVALLFLGVQGRLQLGAVPWALTWPVWVTPQFSVGALVGVALPLFIVTMASQNLPGVAAQRASGFAVPVSPAITTTGLASLVLAPFGGYALNLAAITAAICMGREAHPEPSRRYTASIAAGVFYAITGLAGGAVVAVFASLPREMVLALAGLALVGTIAGALAQATAQEKHRDAAVLTFLVTLSGVSVAGVSSAFWGVVAGSLAAVVQHYRPPALKR
jgi:benzoate membrane transport protein